MQKAITPIFLGLGFVFSANLILIVFTGSIKIVFTSPTSDIYLLALIQIFRYLALFATGIFVGHSLKKNGLLWGAVFGLVTSLFMFYLLGLGEYLFTDHIGFPSNFSEYLSIAPIIISFCALGGYLGERFSSAKKHSKKK